MIDCIAGYHLNPWTCGIAKFNAILAKHLDVHVVGIRTVELGSFQRPLLSLKLSEFSTRDAEDLDLWASAHQGQFELFLHAFDGTPTEQRLVASAGKVWTRLPTTGAPLSRNRTPNRADTAGSGCALLGRDLSEDDRRAVARFRRRHGLDRHSEPASL